MNAGMVDSAIKLRAGAHKGHPYKQKIIMGVSLAVHSTILTIGGQTAC